MSSPARSGRPPVRRPAPSAVSLRAPRAAEPAQAPRRKPEPSPTGFGHTVSHTTGAIRLRSTRSGAPRTGTPRSRARTGQQRSVRATPARPELRLLPVTGPVPSGRALPTQRTRRAPYVLLVVGMLVGTTISLLVLNTAIAVDSLKATSLRKANTQRSEEVQRLQQQVIDAGTPGRLVGDATKAGLVPAGTPGYLVVQPDGTTVLRGTPSPAPAGPPAAPGGQQAPSSPVPAPPAQDPTSAAGD